MHQVGEALGSGLHCVGVDDAGIGIAVISLTDGRLEGLLQEVVGGVADIGQVVKDGKAGVFTLSLLLSLAPEPAVPAVLSHFHLVRRCSCHPYRK